MLIKVYDILSIMASLWDLDKSKQEKLADEWEENGVLEEKVEKHRGKFEKKFKKNMDDEVPKHPYKLYRDIVENNELSEEEKIALEHMKDEF